jgi:hypothetical protein
MYLSPRTVSLIASLARSSRHVGTRTDSKWDTILSWMGHQMRHYLAPMGHHFVPMGHKKGHHSAPMGHYFAMMGHQMGHQSAKMGHEGTPRDTILTPVGVMVKRRASRGGFTRFSGVERPKYQPTVVKANPTPFCDFRGLWYTSTNKFSAQQGWRHGVRSRSLGGIPVTNDRVRTWEI